MFIRINVCMNECVYICIYACVYMFIYMCTYGKNLILPGGGPRGRGVTSQKEIGRTLLYY